MGLVGLWLAATVAVTFVAFEVVGAAESRVAERPLTPVVAIDDTAPEHAEETTTTTLTPVTDPSAPTTLAGGTSTTSTTAPAATPTTAATTATTVEDHGDDDHHESTTTAWTTLNIPTEGGTVTVEHRPEEVRLVAVTARSGFSVGDTELGPPRVRVEFDSPGLRIRVEVRWEDDGPRVEIDEERGGHDGDD